MTVISYKVWVENLNCKPMHIVKQGISVKSFFLPWGAYFSCIKRPILKKFYLTEFPFKQQIKKESFVEDLSWTEEIPGSVLCVACSAACLVEKGLLWDYLQDLGFTTRVNFLVGLTLACLPYKAPYSFPHWVNHKIFYSHSDKWKDDICWEHAWMQPILRIYVFNFIYFCRCPSFYLVIAKWSF